MPLPIQRLALGALLGLTALASHAQAFKLECPDPRGKGVEAKSIKSLAAGVVERRGKHELRVKTAKGLRKLVDKAPHDEPLSGLHYYFCDRKEGFVLLRVEDGSTFTGNLVVEATGQVLPAGQTVLFTPDRKAYWASVQEDGLDGEVWKIYTANGAVSWSGYNFLHEKGEGGRMYAELANPTWAPNGQFIAQAQCLNKLDRTWKVRLTRISGEWDWRPKKACPAP